MFYTVASSLTPEEVGDRMESVVKEAGFGLLHSYTFKELLHAKGFDIENDIRVFEICNPKAASEMVTAHPEISTYMPCRISVYENGGETVLSTIDAETMAGELTFEDAPYKEKMVRLFGELKKIMLAFAGEGKG